jgi:small conductance mechanosensitive channel
MTLKDANIELLIKYGLQAGGALVVLAAGLLLTRWVGNLTQKWLQRQELEPPSRTLIVRFVQIIIIAVTLMVALDTFGV